MALLDTRKRSSRALEAVEGKLRALEEELAESQEKATGLVVNIQQLTVRLEQRERDLEEALAESVRVKADVQRLQAENGRLQELAERRALELQQLPLLRGQVVALRAGIEDLQRELQARARRLEEGNSSGGPDPSRSSVVRGRARVWKLSRPLSVCGHTRRSGSKRWRSWRRGRTWASGRRRRCRCSDRKSVV